MMRAGGALALAALLLAAGAARADGLADLKAALARPSGATPLRMQVDTRITRKLGEGKEAEEESGQAGVLLELSARGLGVTYGSATLAKVQAELRAKSRNPNSKTPTMKALGEIDVSELLSMSSAGPALARAMERSIFKGERSEAWQGKPARLLTFDAPLSSLSDREKKYAKKFESVLQVWVGADGMPLASRMRTAISGRAFVVVSFESTNTEDQVYGAVGEHLVVVRKESYLSSAGAGEREERKALTTLQVQP